jgi:hypothetical protein
MLPAGNSDTEASPPVSPFEEAWDAFFSEESALLRFEDSSSGLLPMAESTGIDKVDPAAVTALAATMSFAWGYRPATLISCSSAPRVKRRKMDDQ